MSHIKHALRHQRRRRIHGDCADATDRPLRQGARAFRGDRGELGRTCLVELGVEIARGLLREAGNALELLLRGLEKALDGSRPLIGKEPPEVTILRGKVAWSLYYLERPREALAMFIRASLAAPDSYQYHLGMGWSYLKLGQRNDARAAFQRAMKLAPSDEGVREGLRRAGI